MSAVVPGDLGQVTVPFWALRPLGKALTGGSPGREITQEPLKGPTAEKATRGQEATWPRGRGWGRKASPRPHLPTRPALAASCEVGTGEGAPASTQGGGHVHPVLSILIRLLDRGTPGSEQPPHKGATSRKGGPESPSQRSRGTCLTPAE